MLASPRLAKIQEYLHSEGRICVHGRGPHCIEYSLSFKPPVGAVGPPPNVELSCDSVNQLLFLARSGKSRIALVVEANNDLLEPLHSIMLHAVANGLDGNEGKGRRGTNVRSKGARD